MTDDDVTAWGTCYFSYVGDFYDPELQWADPSKAASSSNLPRRIVPKERGVDLGISVSWVIQKAKEGAYEGKQLDWGAWGLKMTGRQIQELVTDPPGQPEAHAAWFSASVATEIAALTPERFYVLVAGENY